MKKLGFGCMRLPLVPGTSEVDHVAFCEMVDAFLERGFTYFDTAYPYHGKNGEIAVREALVKRHSRDEFVLATKLPLLSLKSAEEMREIFQSQFARCGVTYFDYYLLHNVAGENYKKAVSFGAFEFAFQQKAAGKLGQVGISFHDSADVLEEILTRYPDIDFVQLQINYLDWDNPSIQSGRCYETARKHHKNIIVMEPLKGGVLSRLPEAAARRLKERDPDGSPSSWGIRFAAGLDGVMMVLSGMSTKEQVLENTASMDAQRPLSEADRMALDEAVGILKNEYVSPCTGCRYCTDGCPQRIAIPSYIALLHDKMRVEEGRHSSHVSYYRTLAASHGKASACIGCGQCERACPQHLPVMSYMEKTALAFENMPPAYKRT